MGIDYDGGMIVGAECSEIKIPDDVEYEGEWFEDIGLEYMSKWYNSGPDGWIVGFQIGDVLISEMDEAWHKRIKELGSKFKELTGAEPKLIGTQNIW